MHCREHAMLYKHSQCTMKTNFTFSISDTSFRKIISLDDILQSNRQFGCAPQQLSTDCSRNTCFNLRYRTMDGTCNNFRNPLLGAAATPFMRLRQANYDDGIGAPTSEQCFCKCTANLVHDLCTVHCRPAVQALQTDCSALQLWCTDSRLVV